MQSQILAIAIPNSYIVIKTKQKKKRQHDNELRDCKIL